MTRRRGLQRAGNGNPPVEASLFGRLVRLGRRGLVLLMGVQLLVAVSLTLVDSYRRRGKKPKPFTTSAPLHAAVGQGSITTYAFGRELFADMLAAIDGAEHRILFETYIWKGDDTGRRFKRALTDAAERGVEVYAIYDGFANLVVSPRFKQFSPAMRVLKYPAYGAGWRFYDVRRYGRDHRKILVVDDRVAFVGGYNIGTAYATQWRDTHVRISGPGVWDLERAFADFWNMKSNQRRSRHALTVDTVADWEPRIRVHRNLPSQWMFPIRSMYLEAISRAQRNIYLTHAYFIPDGDFVEALRTAAGRGVDVRLLLPATSNHVVADWLSRGYYEQLLTGGVRINLFQGAMVHAKTATIDGQWSTVGTANLDRLSMTGNYEINVEFVDPALAERMEEIFAADLINTRELAWTDWESRGVHRRFTEALLAPLRPLL